MTDVARTPIADLRNLGPRTAELLEPFGIHTRGELERVGVVMAYRMIRHRWGSRAINRSGLWALWGALHNVDWRALPDDVKAELTAETADA